MSPLITTELVALDADLGGEKADVIHRLAALVAGAGRATGAKALAADALAREGQAATGLPGGIAIPHCRSAAVTEASLAFARLSPAVDFGAPDGPADLAFLIAAPAEGDADHLTLLTALARALVRPEFVASLRSASSAEEVVQLVGEVVSPPLAAADDPNARRVPGSAEQHPAAAGLGPRPSTGAEIRRWLLTGVSYMIPFIAAGGLLIALGFLLAGYPIALKNPTGTPWATDWVLNNALWNLPTSTVAHLHGRLAGYPRA